MPVTICHGDGNSGNSKNARTIGLGGPSLKWSHRAGQLIQARSLLLNSPEMREHMDALAESWQLAYCAGHTLENYQRHHSNLRDLEQIVDRLFTWQDLNGLAERWATISAYLDECPDYAGIFCGVGGCEQTGMEIRLYPDGQSSTVLVDDRRHAGKGRHDRDNETLERAVLSLRIRLRPGYVSGSDAVAAEEINRGRNVRYWVDPQLVKRDRQKLRQLVGSL